MQKITLLTVGSPRASWIRDALDEYLCRLPGFCDFSVTPLKPSKSTDARKQREEESERIFAVLEKCEGQVWVLDEKGRQYTSADFAQQLGQLRDAGEPLTFVLGGAYGLTDAVLQRADRILALSSMTFPHELCQLIFVEQLYRAMQIQKGTGYHH
jgi:23S rRNA (pseudouridine1915-N3)-methyltransferase